jgi:hypothetical protein
MVSCPPEAKPATNYFDISLYRSSEAGSKVKCSPPSLANRPCYTCGHVGYLIDRWSKYRTSLVLDSALGLCATICSERMDRSSTRRLLRFAIDRTMDTPRFAGVELSGLFLIYSSRRPAGEAFAEFNFSETAPRLSVPVEARQPRAFFRSPQSTFAPINTTTRSPSRFTIHRPVFQSLYQVLVLGTEYGVLYH